MQRIPVHEAIAQGVLPPPSWHGPLSDDSVVALNGIDMVHGEPRPFSAVMRTIHAMLEPHARYAIGGALAFGLYGPAHATPDLDVFIRPEDEGSARDRFRERGWRFRKRGAKWRAQDVGRKIDVDLIVDSEDPLCSGIETAQRQWLFGQRMPVLAPEFVIWTMLVGSLRGNSEARAFGSRLLYQGHVSLETLARYLVHAGERESMQRLAVWATDEDNEKRAKRRFHRVASIKTQWEWQRREAGLVPKRTLSEMVEAGELESFLHPSELRCRFLRAWSHPVRFRPLTVPLILT